MSPGQGLQSCVAAAATIRLTMWPTTTGTGAIGTIVSGVGTAVAEGGQNNLLAAAVDLVLFTSLGSVIVSAATVVAVAVEGEATWTDEGAAARNT